MKFSVVHRTAYHKPTVLEDGTSFISCPSLTNSLISSADDILYELANETDDLLGLDHVNKTRSFWNRGDSIFIR
jgi:ubiquitin carboxyl-terminal hydrolase 7